MEPKKKKSVTLPGEDWAQVKKSAKFWIPTCLSITALLLIFSILLTYVLATDAQRKRDLRTIAEQQRMEEEQKKQETEEKEGNLAILESLLRDRSLFGAEVSSQDFLQKVFELYKKESGDKYAAYYTEEGYRIRLAQLSGQTVGIGITQYSVTVSHEGSELPALFIKSVSPNSPAEAEGLTAGDCIIAVGNSEGELQTIEELGGYEKATLAISGEEGTNVTLRVLSKQGEASSIRNVTCQRRQVQTKSVVGYCLESDFTIAIIRIREFLFNTPAQFDRAIEECRAAGATKFILDVRDNPGGSLIALRAMLSGFLQNGDTAYYEKRADGSLQAVSCVPCTYTGEKEACSVTEEQIGRYSGLSFALLCNQNTQSAAEVFAAVLSEKGIATFGQTTFGKWLAQTSTEVPFKDFKGYISFSVYQCFTPGNQSYQDTGFTPDNIIDFSEEQDIQQAAVAYFTANS